MDKKTKIIWIVEVISGIFELSNNVKTDLYNKLETFDDNKLVEIAKMLLDYESKQSKKINDLLLFLKISKNQIIEMKEKKIFLEDNKGPFDNL